MWPKLREWYVKDLAKSRIRPLDTPEQLLDVIPALHALPFDELPGAMRETTASLRHSYESRGLPVPGWISSIYGWADYLEKENPREQS